MKISVIIPTYKPQDYLWQCLDSLCNQTFPQEDFEIILVLNGCKDPYDEDITAYIEKHSDINWNYIQTDVPGVSNARNLGLDAVKGEYVTFVDDDDYVSSVYLQELYDKADEQTVSLCCPYAFYGEDVSNSAPYFTDVFEEFHDKGDVSISKVRKYFSGPCMKLIPMSFIQGRRYDVRFKNGEDSLFMFLISDKISKCRFTSPEAVYYRRYREGSAFTSHHSLWSKIKNSTKLAFTMIGYYLRNIRGYKIGLLYTRIRGLVASVIKDN